MLKVHTRNLGNVAILCLQGHIVYGEKQVLRDAVNSLAGVSVIILDLAQVTTIDASGLGVMLELLQRAESKGIRFELMNPTRLVRRVLEIVHLDTVFQIRSSVEFFPSVSRSSREVLGALAPCA
jgi:anti-sigma B factor antagonist